MTTRGREPRERTGLSLERILHPPWGERPFWVVQSTLLIIVTVHYLVDLRPAMIVATFPTGVPVALLVIPIGYAALRYGLTGSVATAAWALLLWLPDLLLPHDEGHVGDDLMNLAIVVVVAFIFGRSVERQRHTQRRADEATARTFAVEAGYRRLFEANRAPILVLDDESVVTDANRAAKTLLGASVIGRSSRHLVGGVDLEARAGDVLTLDDGRDYRLNLVTMPLGPRAQRRQLNFEDVTEERSDERRARQFAQQIVQVEEDQRRRLSRELHDEPLQLFLHLARRLELLSSDGRVPSTVADGLHDARRQALDAANKLRTVARDLRPPALDELGLAPALSSLAADADADADDEGTTVNLSVHGDVVRLSPDVELAAFRIVQESLRNALRHAHARHVRVDVHFARHELRLATTDDGQGFRDAVDSSHTAPTEFSSMGIVGMRERARLMNGVLHIRSTPGVGTRVEVTVPLTFTHDAASLSESSRRAREDHGPEPCPTQRATNTHSNTTTTSGLYIGVMSETSFYPTVSADFARTLELVGPDQWATATPCEDWNVFDLVTHVIATHRRVYKMAVTDYAEPTLDTIDAWREIHDALLAALDDPILAATPVQSRRGEQPFSALVGGLLTFDTLAHTWDLARAIGASEELNVDAIAHAARELEPIGDALRVPGGFGPAVEAAPDANPQTRLLNFLGRRP